ncbi:hypothetical protein Tco_0880590 [Tanacetum coccineum]
MKGGGDSGRTERRNENRRREVEGVGDDGGERGTGASDVRNGRKEGVELGEEGEGRRKEKRMKEGGGRVREDSGEGREYWRRMEDGRSEELGRVGKGGGRNKFESEEVGEWNGEVEMSRRGGGGKVRDGGEVDGEKGGRERKR